MKDPFSIHLCIHLPTQSSTPSFTHPSIHLSPHSSICPPIHLSLDHSAQGHGWNMNQFCSPQCQGTFNLWTILYYYWFIISCLVVDPACGAIILINSPRRSKSCGWTVQSSCFGLVRIERFLLSVACVHVSRDGRLSQRHVEQAVLFCWHMHGFLR